ncbi:MAG: NTP transferase domain-containing protein [bacterium]|nr:NTP transferase domain-containing protein [bacterium]
MQKTRIVVLAGGKGTRMRSKLPKALAPLFGKPLFSHLLASVDRSAIDKKPIVVVGYQKDVVVKELGSKYEYAIQEEQLGTGHAVLAAKDACGDAENVMVLYVDHPLITPDTIKNLAETHSRTGAKITMATATVPDFSDWRAFLYSNFSRIVRDESGDIVKDVQFRDATDEEKELKEINPCYFCFDAEWLWQKLQTLQADNDQKQYYLTDLLKIAVAEKASIESIQIDPREALGANSKEELEILEKMGRI